MSTAGLSSSLLHSLIPSCTLHIFRSLSIMTRLLHTYKLLVQSNDACPGSLEYLA